MSTPQQSGTGMPKEPPQFTPEQKAAAEWAGKHWHKGLKIAGADSNYVAFWAFCAGTEFARTELSAAQAEVERLKAWIADPAALHAHCVRTLSENQVAHLFGERMTVIQNDRDSIRAQLQAKEQELAETKAKQPINTNVRLFDLVRYMRAELHAENLINDDEYAWLCMSPMAKSKEGGSPSPRRLEDYDAIRQQLAAEKAAGLAKESEALARDATIRVQAEEIEAVHGKLTAAILGGAAEIDSLRARDARSQSTIAGLRDALTEIGAYKGEGGPNTPWRDIVRDCGERARNALALVPPLSAVELWQPIETAPRDDTEILIKTSIGVVSAWFHADPGECYEWVCYDDKFTIDGDDGSVTHWMPLAQAAPKAQPPTPPKPDALAELPGGYRCEKCNATGPYLIDGTTPRNAFRVLFDSCPSCDPDGEDSYRYIDASGKVLSIFEPDAGQARERSEVNRPDESAQPAKFV